MTHTAPDPAPLVCLDSLMRYTLSLGAEEHRAQLRLLPDSRWELAITSHDELPHGEAKLQPAPDGGPPSPAACVGALAVLGFTLAADVSWLLCSLPDGSRVATLPVRPVPVSWQADCRWDEGA